MMAALGSGLGVTLWQANVARQEARTAKAVKDFMQGVFLANTASQADPKKGRHMTARELLDTGAEKVDAALADAPEAKMEMLKMFMELYNQLGEFDLSARFAERWVAMARQIYGRDSNELVEALLLETMARRLASIDNPDQREPLEEVEAILDRRGDDRSLYRAGYLALAASYYMDHDFPRASDYAQRAMALARSPAMDPGELPYMAARTADMFLQAGNYDAARAVAVEGIAVAHAANQGTTTALEDRQYIRLPVRYERLGQAEWGLGDLVSAEKQLREAWRAARQTFGDETLDTLRIQARLADLLLLTGRQEEGWTLLDLAAGLLAKRPAGGSSSYWFLALAMVGHTQADVGQYPTALDNLSKALAMRTGIDASPAVAEVLRDQSRVLMALHRDAEATEALDRAVAMRVKSGLRNSTVERQEADLRVRLSAPPATGRLAAQRTRSVLAAK